MRFRFITRGRYVSDSVREYVTFEINYIKWYVSDWLRRFGTLHWGERGVSTDLFLWLRAERDRQLCVLLVHPADLSLYQRAEAVRGGQW